MSYAVSEEQSNLFGKAIEKSKLFMMQYCIICLLLGNTCILWLMQQCYDVILQHPKDCLSKKI
jgi:hypothetical protein